MKRLFTLALLGILGLVGVLGVWAESEVQDGGAFNGVLTGKANILINRSDSTARIPAGDASGYQYVRDAYPDRETYRTETNIITLQNIASNVLGGTNTNRSPIQVDWISASGEGNDPLVIRAVRGTTLGGSPSYTAYSANTSIVSFDVAGTTVTGGTEVWSCAIGKSGNVTQDVSGLRLMLNPGETMTFAGSSATNAKVFIRVGWRELY